MVPLRPVLVLPLVAAVLVVACGFTGDGTLEGAVSQGGAPAPGADASIAQVDAAQLDGSVVAPGCNPTCVLPAPLPGWNLVLFGTSSTDACPVGFEAADAIESPVAAADACQCAECVKTGTTCSTGAIPTKADNGGGACAQPASTLDANAGACMSMNGSLGTDARVDAPAAVRGTCTSAASPVRANVVTQPRRVCTLRANACAETACALPASMAACTAAAGDVPCPSGTKHLVGADVTLACPSCACAISSATCGGTMDFYTQSNNCTGTPITLTAGVCKFTNGAGILSAKWKGIIATEQCATTPAAPTTTLTGAQTICCR